MSCVLHTGAKDKAGYGYVRRLGKTILAHRWAYCVAHGILPEVISGKVVRHTCDNPSCINPNHLLIGTHQDNVNDKVSRGRQARQPREINGMTKLSVADVAYTCSVYVPRCREFGTRALARRFNVSQSAVGKAIKSIK